MVAITTSLGIIQCSYMLAAAQFEGVNFVLFVD